MKYVTLVNDVAELKGSMASWLIPWSAARRGIEAHLCGVQDLSWSEAGARVHATPVRRGDDAGRALTATKNSRAVDLPLDSGDVLLLRTNPARDPERAGHHQAALGIARLAAERGVLVLNAPDAIERVGNKLFLAELPAAVRPRQLVTSRWAELLAFARAEAGPVVLKPLYGTRGDGVLKLDVRLQGPEALLDAASRLLDLGPVVAQEYLVDAPAGDTRVLMVDGEVLTVDGHRAAVRRVPQPGEFRSNVHLGAVAAPGVWTPGLERVAAAVGPALRRAGVFLAGVDVVGDRLVEVNAWAPGGFGNAESFEGVDFLGALVDKLEERRTRAG